MKLILYMIAGLPHPKNWTGLQRMCRKSNIEFEYTTSLERIQQNNYDILCCMCSFISPHIIPSSIKIIYGPQFWVVPERPVVGPLDSSLVGRCVFNSLSQWVKDFYLEMASEFIMPISTFPISVDTNKFQPLALSQKKEYDCIVYIKRRSTAVVNATISLLDSKKLNYKVFRYGSYNEDDYLSALRQSKFMLTLDAHESQGFALEEAMSSGVPLLVVDATTMYDETNDGVQSTYEYLRPKKLLTTSVPYWSDECGIRITELTDLPEALDKMRINYESFTPREYVMRTLSDEVCMKRILDYFHMDSYST